ncbi:hypothetical protein IKG10_01635 [Candidatus Saccharibacteria bacterium]|nr:hypothetical protein [Candidatus Saccharibacteria bacterium]
MEDNTKKENTVEKLAGAFKPEKKPKKKLISTIIFVVGLVTLVSGLVFLILNLTSTPAIQDGKYLTSAKEWVLSSDANCNNKEENEINCEPGVIWKFTEIGKGTLTTNNHINDYDFIWSLKDGKLLIETAWLYDLNNEYEYELNQGNGTLTLKDGDKEFNFTAKFATE